MGLDALSVESAMTFRTPASIAASTTCWEPVMFVAMNSEGLYSAVSTCFSAAACTTWSTPCIARVRRRRSRTSPMNHRRRGSSPSCWRSSYCLSSSREKTTTRAGSASVRMCLRNVLPKEPVPPVIRMDDPFNSLNLVLP